MSLRDWVRERTPEHRRRRVVRVRLRARRWTANLRALPDFLLVGTMRGGSSSLFQYLAAHPDLRRSLRKETEYFGLDFDHDVSWYRAHFPVDVPRRRWKTFEATPYYLFHPAAARRAANLLPAVKVVALLRDPVERAYSHYQHMVRLGFEPLSFAGALHAEPDRLAVAANALDGGRTVSALSHHRYSYAARGHYLPQLRRWESALGRDQCLWLFAEDLYSDPSMVLHDIADFVGVPPWTPAEFRNYSYRLGERQRSAVPAAARRRLLDEYMPGYVELATHLDRELPWGME